MSKKQERGSPQRLVWRMVISTLIIVVVVVAAAKLLPSVVAPLVDRFEEFMKYLESLMIF